MMSSCFQFDSPINVFMLDLKKCAALMYAPLTLGEDPKRLPVTVEFERHHEQYRWHQRFLRRKYRIWIKNGNIHSDTWANFYRSFYVYSIHIVQYSKKLEGSLMFLQKVSFGNWRWKKKKTPQRVLIKSRKSCYLNLKLHIKFTAFPYFSYTFVSVRCFAYITKI